MHAITLLVTAVLLLFYALGILLLKAGLKDIRYGLGARTWPMAPARLERCVVHRRPGGSGVAWQVSVKYAYTVAGVTYTGDNLAIGYFGSRDRALHERTRQSILDMATFRIRYHPGKPEVSTIFPAENSLIFGTLVMGLLWLSMTTGFALIALAVSGVGHTILGWFG